MNCGVFKLLQADHSSGITHPKQIQKATPKDNTPSSTEGLFQGVILSEIAHLSPETVPHRLLEHYANNIATIMVWLDSDLNAYRRLVIPLAEREETLMLAILAMAGAHASDAPQAANQMLDASQTAYENAMLRIAESLRTIMASKVAGSNDINQFEPLIAAALVLSNFSLFRSQVSLAQLHFNAVRTLIKGATLNGMPTGKNLFIFLQNQAAAYDVLACTTTFDQDHVRGAILPEFDRNENFIFGQYLVVLHSITTTSLSHGEEATEVNHPDSGSSENATMGDLEDQFELARASTLQAAAVFSAFSRPLINDDFIRIVQAYHHAGLIYAHRRLKGFGTSESESHHSSRLFQVLNKFRDINSVVHNLAWPIFIAGICSQPDCERMATVRRLSRVLVETTRFGHYNDISRFHEDLWKSPHNDWITLARDWERRGTPLIPV